MRLKRYYFDYAAGTPLDSRVKKAMEPYWSKKFGNPGALHWFGQEASAAIFQARDIVAKSIGANYREIIFTSSATEANNLALRGAVKMVQQFSTGTAVLSLQRREPATPRSDFPPSAEPSKSELRSFRTKTAEPFLPKIIVSSIEHDSILETARDLEKDGVEVVYLPVDKNGLVDLKKLKDALDERTILVSAMYVNNEVGIIQPISKISEIIRNFREVKSQKLNVKSSAMAYPLLHTDAVQAFNYLNCDVNELGVDLLTLSAQKIYGPKGAGALFMKHETRNLKQKEMFHASSFMLHPIITGGNQQEYGLRGGTENVPAIVGFGKAVELVEKSRNSENKRLRKLQEYFLARMKKIAPKAKLNGPEDLEKRNPNNLNFYFPGSAAQELLIKLDLAGFAVSPGSACTARTCQPSHVLTAMGHSEERAMSSLRFTFGRPTTKAEIDRLTKVLMRVL
ncbi:MAG: cysteine desulfurase [Candidatus Harrisonbacteria bacterium]|nr:cysteine desulfurase [Candidatus Harrisonbacteria bacterium]